MSVLNKSKIFAKGCSRAKQGNIISEDAHAVFLEQGLLILSDGVGGHCDGDLASRELVSAIGSNIISHIIRDGAVLRKEIMRYHNTVMRSSDEKLLKQRPGATVALVSAQGDKLYYANVGDSRIYIFRSGILKQLSRDHILGQSCSNILTSAIGVTPRLEIHSGMLSISAGDVILLSSDGLTDYVEDAIIAELLNSNSDMDFILESLVNRAFENHTRDDVTLLLMQVI